MSIYHAVKVTKMEELENEINNNSAVILVDNRAIAKEIRKACDEDVDLTKRAKELRKKGLKKGGAAVGIVAVGFVGSLFLAPAAAVAVFVVGAFTGIGMGISSVANIFSSIANTIAKNTSLTRNYKWFDSNGKTVLYKANGVNSFDPNKDEVTEYKKTE